MAGRNRITLGIRERLTLLFFIVPAIALSINYLTVVPRLENQLRNDKLQDLKRTVRQSIDPTQPTYAQIQATLGQLGAQQTLISNINGRRFLRTAQPISSVCGCRCTTELNQLHHKNHRSYWSLTPSVFRRYLRPVRQRLS